VAGSEEIESNGAPSLRVAVVGGGVGGLAAALALARAGHAVTVLERDRPALDGDPEAAFAAERRGAPQSHQTHGFLARIVAVLRERFPDVLDGLRAAGCTVLPAALDLGEPQPGDEDLVVLVMRRTTFEMVLRQAVQREPGVELRTGACVVGLTAGGAVTWGAPARAGAPHVDGVRLEGGEVVDADLVIAATGRRDQVVPWLGGIGADVGETVVPSGLVYLSRWYRLPPGEEITFEPKLGGDLGYVKYLGVPGDGGTLSVTLAVRATDSELRGALVDPHRFERACRLLPGPDQFFTRGPLAPIGGMRPMGGLVNRLRRFADPDGDPVVLGFHAVGDAHTCTNPLYGRGCSLALVQAVLLADAVAAHPADPRARAAAYEAACRREIEPWYDLAVQTDAAGSDPTGHAGGELSPQARAMAALFVAGATDPVIGRALARLWNLLALPADLATDSVTAGRMMEVMANPDAYPPPEREGPSRAELVAALGGVPDGGAGRAADPDDADDDPRAPEALTHG
jgi:2-polyprenyl-6-methoxyphenol hydroxylase-like FAD-dependent oxidoreductase